MAYDGARVKPEEVDTYEELASPRFRGRLCVRSADNIYNLSLVGALIEAWGEPKTEEWARGIVANMARPPEGANATIGPSERRVRRPIPIILLYSNGEREDEGDRK